MNRWRISYYLKNQTGLNEQRISNLHIRLINSKIMDENEKQMMMSLRKHTRFTFSTSYQHHYFQMVRKDKSKVGYDKGRLLSFLVKHQTFL